LIDLVWSLLLLTPLRGIVIPFLSIEKKRSYQLFKDAEAVFVKGGGFIHCYGGTTALYYIYFQLFHIFLAQSLGKDVFIFPNSFGPFEGWGVKTLVRKALRNSKVVTARETRSSVMCKKYLNIDVITYPDFGFYLPNGNIDNKEKFLEQLEIPNGRKLVAITARPHRFPHANNPKVAYNNFVVSMRDFAEWLYEKGYFPVFIEHVYAINNHENDSYCINDVIKNMDKRHYAYFINRDLNCQQLKTVYSYFDFIVGTRFHSMIFSMSNMIPGIAITYVGNKGEGIMDDMGMTDYYIKIGEVTSDKLKQKFKFLVTTEVEAKNNIRNYLESADLKRRIFLNSIRK
jgi:colanic acid/amylovoran biosynthesis protein